MAPTDPYSDDYGTDEFGNSPTDGASFGTPADPASDDRAPTPPMHLGGQPSPVQPPPDPFADPQSTEQSAQELDLPDPQEHMAPRSEQVEILDDEPELAEDGYVGDGGYGAEGGDGDDDDNDGYGYGDDDPYGGGAEGNGQSLEQLELELGQRKVLRTAGIGALLLGMLGGGGYYAWDNGMLDKLPLEKLGFGGPSEMATSVEAPAAPRFGDDADPVELSASEEIASLDPQISAEEGTTDERSPAVFVSASSAQASSASPAKLLGGLFKSPEAQGPAPFSAQTPVEDVQGFDPFAELDGLAVAPETEADPIEEQAFLGYPYGQVERSEPFSGFGGFDSTFQGEQGEVALEADEPSPFEDAELLALMTFDFAGEGWSEDLDTSSGELGDAFGETLLEDEPAFAFATPSEGSDETESDAAELESIESDGEAWIDPLDAFGILSEEALADAGEEPGLDAEFGEELPGELDPTSGDEVAVADGEPEQGAEVFGDEQALGLDEQDPSFPDEQAALEFEPELEGQLAQAEPGDAFESDPSHELSDEFAGIELDGMALLFDEPFGYVEALEFDAVADESSGFGDPALTDPVAVVEFEDTTDLGDFSNDEGATDLEDPAAWTDAEPSFDDFGNFASAEPTQDIAPTEQAPTETAAAVEFFDLPEGEGTGLLAVRTGDPAGATGFIELESESESEAATSAPGGFGTEDDQGPAFFGPGGSVATPGQNFGQGGERETRSGELTYEDQLDLPRNPGGLSMAEPEDFNHMWLSESVPTDAVSGDRLLLTPSVGGVRLHSKNEEVFDGRLFAVGNGTYVLENRMGRMTLNAADVVRVERLVNVPLELRTTPFVPTGDRVQIRTAGGYLYGHVLSQTEGRVLLLTDRGARLTLEDVEVEPAARDISGASLANLRQPD